jgi:hypothetical protein
MSFALVRRAFGAVVTAAAVLLALGGLAIGLAVRRAQTPPPGEVPASPSGPATPIGPEPVLTGGPTR